MKKILTLTKVMLKNTNIGVSTSTKQKSSKKIATYLGVGFLFVVLSFSMYFLSKDILIALQNMGQESISIQAVMVAFTLYLIVSGVVIVPLVFYFSKDVEGLLALPLIPFEILTAKAITTYVNLLVASSFIIVPFGIAYQMILQPSFVFSIFYFLAFLIIPMIPLVISMAFIIILFTFLPKVNNKNLFTYFSSIAMLVVILGINIGTSNLDANSAQYALDNLSFLNRIATFIPTLGLLIKAVTELSILPLLGSLLLSFILSYVVLLALSKLYFKGVLAAQISTKKIRKRKLKNKKSESQIIALMKSDVRNILRTPSMMINYFLPIVIFPLLLFVPLIFNINSEDLQIINEVLANVRDWLKNVEGFLLVPYLVFLSFIISYFNASFTTITSTSISREGERMQTYKSMPIDMMMVVNSKILLGILTGAIIPVLFVIIAGILLRLNIIAILIMMISIIVALIFSNTGSIILDLIKPKLEWDDEIQAIKQNFLSIIPIFVSFGVSAFLVVLFLKFDTLFTALSILVVAGAISVFNYKIIIQKYGLKKLDQAIQKL